MNWHGLHVSVRDPSEARAALEGGAAIIDVKEPSAGPLGAAAPETISAIAATVGRSAPWTHACGELIEGGRTVKACAGRILRAVELVHLLEDADSTTRPAAVKAGLSGTAGLDWQGMLGRIAGGLPSGIALVAVAYADWQAAEAPSTEAVIAAAAGVGCSGLLVDTHGKCGPGLFGHADPATVTRWVEAAHGAGLPIALAGKLALDDLEAAVASGADVVGVRSAVCVGSPSAARLGVVCRERVQGVVDRLAAVATADRAAGRVPVA